LSVEIIAKAAVTEIFSVSEATAHYSPTFARQPKRLIPFIKTKKSYKYG
jgi:hypothetical protein